MALTEMEVRNAKPGAKIAKLSDGGGLQLWISPDGAKRWRLAYRFNEAQKTLAIGVYPSVGLKDAREARARNLLNPGPQPPRRWPRRRRCRASPRPGAGRAGAGRPAG